MEKLYGKLVGKMTDKFMCEDCLKSTFALSNPHTCPHCGGTMVRVESRYVPTDVPSTLAYQYGVSTEDMVEQFLMDLDRWHKELE